MYELLLKNNLVSFPITEEAEKKIAAIVENINNSYFGSEIYETVEIKIVAYLYFLIKDHPFTDGNKRTACLVFEVGCDINGIKPIFNEFTLDELAVFIETVKDDDYQDIIKAISKVLFL